MKTFVRESIVAGAMGLLGPRGLTSDELNQAEQQAKVQDAYIDRFQIDMTRLQPFNPDKTIQVVVTPAPMTPGQFIARAESYGACVWGNAQEIARATYAREAIFDQERRRLHPAEHCKECVEYASRGFVPIGSLPACGEASSCRQNCVCSFEYRLTDAGEIHAIG